MEITDIHCHLVPEVDDGARSKKEAYKLLEMEYKSGVRNIIVTPHYRRGMFETPQEEIREKFLWLRRAARNIASDFQVYLGCEFHTTSRIVPYLEEKKRPTLAGTSYVLVEFSARHSYERIRTQIMELTAHRYQPIIAHVERYPCLLENPERILELRELGAKIQINADSILGEDGRKVKNFCKKMMKEDWMDYVGSDAHQVRERRPNIGRCAKYVEKKMGREYAEQIFVNNPEQILKEYRRNRQERMQKK